MADERVTVVIPNWNGLPHLPDCFAALRRQTLRDFRVVVVDNASTDESLAWLSAHAPEAEVVRMPANGGFSYAVNEGIRRARGEYVALLNNDTAAEPGWLQALVRALDERSDYDIAASRMVFFDRPEVLNAAGDVFDVVWMAAKNRGIGEPADRYGRADRVLGACAGAALYRRRLFDDVGLFDEEFFLFHEDTDINLRALLAGKRCLYVPDAVIRHKLGGTTSKEAPRAMDRLRVRNEIAVLVKDVPTPLLPLACAGLALRELRYYGDVRPSSREKRRARWRSARDRVAWQGEGVRMGLRKRAEVQRRRTIGSLAVLRWLALGSARVAPP